MWSVEVVEGFPFAEFGFEIDVAFIAEQCPSSEHLALRAGVLARARLGALYKKRVYCCKMVLKSIQKKTGLALSKFWYCCNVVL